MAVTVNQNRPGGYLVLRATGNDFVARHVSNTAGEIIQTMAVTEVLWSVDASQRWTLTRGGDTVAVFTGSGHHDYQSSGVMLEANNTQLQANCNVALSGGNGYIIVKLHKVSGE